ncbi:hypothetical protein GCM10028791_10020 [Echinicola sediminis]
MKINLYIFSATLFLIVLGTSAADAQTAMTYFNQAAKEYVNSDYGKLGQTLSEGLQKYPDDPKLNALKEKLKDDQEKENQEQQDQEKNQDQQQQDQQQQEKESKDGQGEEQTQEDGAQESDKMDEKRGEKSNREEPMDEKSTQESDLTERQKAMEELKQKLQQMNISPEQAQQILDAMNNAEMQYIQQTRKKPTKRPDKSLPDW